MIHANKDIQNMMKQQTNQSCVTAVTNLSKDVNSAHRHINAHNVLMG